MINNWLYNNPTWLTGGVIVGMFVLGAWIGLFIFQRLVPIEMRQRHNDVAGFLIAIVGVVYAVLLAFMAVAVWESFADADKVTQREANLVENLYRDAVAFPEPLRSQLRDELKQYLHLVIDQEWPAQQAGKTDLEAWRPLEDLHRELTDFDAKSVRDGVVQEEALRTLNQLYSARRDRILAATEGIPGVVWGILLLGGGITVFFSFLFGTQHPAMHYLMTGLLAASGALVIVLIVSLDYPFRGDLSVSSDAFQAVFRDVAPMKADSR